MNNSKTYYYARVSSTDQNLARQFEAFKALGAEERDIIYDKKSGKDLDRTGYQMLKTQLLRSGDTLVIKSFDRLSRNKQDILDEVEYFRKNNIRLKVIDVPTTMTDYPEGQEWIMELVNRLMIELLSTFADQERLSIKKRQREGIDAMPIDEATGKRYSAKTGKSTGRQVLVAPDNWDKVYTDWKAGNMTAKAAMELTGLKRTSFYKLVKITESQM